MIAIVLGLIAGIPLALLRGFVLTKLWVWFAMDAFPQLPSLGLVNAIGLTYLVGLLIYKPDTTADDQSAGAVVLRAAAQALLVTLMTWGFGYLWYVLR